MIAQGQWRARLTGRAGTLEGLAVWLTHALHPAPFDFPPRQSLDGLRSRGSAQLMLLCLDLERLLTWTL